MNPTMGSTRWPSCKEFMSFNKDLDEKWYRAESVERMAASCQPGLANSLEINHDPLVHRFSQP